MTLWRSCSLRCTAVTVLALALISCDRHRQDEPPPPIRPVLSVVVQPRPAETLRNFSGTVEARYQSELGFQTAGRMITRTVNVGDVVKRGQELATLDPAVQQLAVASAQADLVNAQAQSTNAVATFQRQDQLLKTQSTTQAQLDAATAGRDTAQARVDQAKANLDKARQQLGYTHLINDYDGVVASWSVEVGQVVTAAQTVVTIARPDARDAVFDIPDDLIGRFAMGARFTVHLLVDDSLTAEGVVREIAPQSDPATRSRRVKLTLEAPPQAFRLGTTIRTELKDSGPPQITIPATALLDKDGKTSVWLVAAGSKVASRSVTLAAHDENQAVVTSGLDAGDRVIIAGVHSISDGQPVKVEAP